MESHTKQGIFLLILFGLLVSTKTQIATFGQQFQLILGEEGDGFPTQERWTKFHECGLAMSCSHVAKVKSTGKFIMFHFGEKSNDEDFAAKVQRMNRSEFKRLSKKFEREVVQTDTASPSTNPH